jgi:hypothetical protein
MIARAGFADLGGLAGVPGPLTASFTNTGNILFVLTDEPNEDPTSVTFNGVSLTLLFNTRGSTTGAGLQLYYLKAPPLTTANIVITMPGASVFMDAAAVSYSGVDLISFDATSSTLDGVSEVSYSSTGTTIANNCWGVGFAHSTNDSTVSVGGDFALVVIAATFFNCLIADTNGPVSPARALTFTTSGNAANVAEHVFVSLRPALVLRAQACM